MGLFDDVLSQGESLIKNEYALDYEFLPKILPFREKEQRYLADCIKPLFANRNGRNLLIHGAPGIGKTAATKAVIRDLEEQSDEVSVIYINCWHQNTTYKVMVEIAEQLGFKFTQNKNTTDLVKVVTRLANEQTGVVFVFDEIDKAEDTDFLYSLLEEIHKKCIFIITNYKSWLLELDERVKSRLMPELVQFSQYNITETGKIITERCSYAFAPNIWDQEALDEVIKKAFEAKDIRTGLFIMKQSSIEAESKASKKILKDHVTQALAKMGEFTIKKSTDLDEEAQFVYGIVKQNTGKKIGDLFRIYQKEGGKVSYKTFQRKISYLDESRFVTLERKVGDGGNTTIVNKKITDF